MTNTALTPDPQPLDVTRPLPAFTPRFPRMALAGVACVLPGRDLPGAWIDNEELAALSERVVERLAERGVSRPVPASTADFPYSRAGIRGRAILDASLSSRDLAVAAGRRALEQSGVDPSTIECVIVSTVTADQVFPALATTVQSELGLPSSAAAFDLCVGCSGALIALDAAGRYLLGAKDGATALVIAAETMVRLADASDRGTSVLFGDGAGAFVVERTRDARIWPVRTYTEGEHGDRIVAGVPADCLDEPLYRFVARGGKGGVEEDRASHARLVLDGRRVFRDMVRIVPGRIREYLEEQGVALEDVDRVVLHQANQRMIEAIAGSSELGLSPEQVPSNIEHVGNTASASIPILLAELLASGAVRPGQRVLMVGFGSGYSLALCLLEV